MKRILALMLSVLLLAACGVSFAEPVTLHVEKGNYTLDLTVADVRIEDGKLIVDCNIENNELWSFDYLPPLVYAVYDGTKYQVESYTARLGGSSSGNMVLAGAAYNIPYSLSELPEEIYAEASADNYQLVWTIADAAPAEDAGNTEGAESNP